MSHNLKNLTDLSQLQDKLFKDAESLEQQIQVKKFLESGPGFLQLHLILQNFEKLFSMGRK